MMSLVLLFLINSVSTAFASSDDPKPLKKSPRTPPNSPSNPPQNSPSNQPTRYIKRIAELKNSEFNEDTERRIWNRHNPIHRFIIEEVYQAWWECRELEIANLEKRTPRVFDKIRDYKPWSEAREKPISEKTGLKPRQYNNR